MNLFYKNSFKFINTKINTAYIAIGSNKGNRFLNISKATELLRRKVKVIKTSQIYENPCLDQNNKIVEKEDFFNAAIKVQTRLNPFELLSLCRKVETDLHREDKMYYNQPREIDLDIILFNNDYVNEERLKIPHQRFRERVFVLKPLLDIDPNLSFKDQLNNDKETKVVDLLNKICKVSKYDNSDFNPHSNFDNHNKDELIKADKLDLLVKVSCYNNNKYFKLSKKLVMGIVNITDDSFSSDDVVYNLNDVKNNKSKNILKMLVDNLEYIDIIDIGGESTRPNAPLIDDSVELGRVIPLIKEIKKHERLKNKIISIDTRKSKVAKECLDIGVDIVNDVSGGRFDPDILKLVAKYNCSYISMHSRGTPINMNKLMNYTDTVTDTITEIKTQLEECRKAGINDWNIWVDPGLGFAKNVDQNYEILSKLDLFKMNFANPLLVGGSRKRFVSNYNILNKRSDCWR